LGHRKDAYKFNIKKVRKILSHWKFVLFLNNRNGRALVGRCDACLRIGGPSQGADEMVALAKAHGRGVYYRIEDVPGV
jgi:hypothetical protein